MASPPPPVDGFASDPVFLETLMSRLQLRPPFLHTNSFLSHSLDDFLLQLNSDDDDDDDDDDVNDGDDDGEDDSGGDEDNWRRMLAKEEAQLGKEIIRIVRSGGAEEVLKPNSGQSVSIGDHNICVAFHEDSGSEYRVWEWHGHIMNFDYEEGYSAEYIYGNYFERLADRKTSITTINKNKQLKEEEIGRHLGLRDLIVADSKKGGSSTGRGRVLHRNALNGGLAARKTS